MINRAYYKKSLVQTLLGFHCWLLSLDPMTKAENYLIKSTEEGFFERWVETHNAIHFAEFNKFHQHCEEMTIQNYNAKKKLQILMRKTTYKFCYWSYKFSYNNCVGGMFSVLKNGSRHYFI